MTRTVRAVAAPLIILVGIAILVALVRTKPQARRAAPESRAPLVETTLARPPAAGVQILGQGTVIPARQVVLQAEVRGRVLAVHPELVPGGRTPAGAALVRLDQRDYTAALDQRRAALESARLARDVEASRKTVAEREWKLVGKGKPAERSLAMREPQLASAEASLVAAQSAVAKAELDLARATVRAPFNAVVLAREAEVGQVVTAQSRLATLAGTDAYWVRLSVPTDALRFLTARSGDHPGSSATVVQRTGRLQTQRTGEVVRVLADVDPVGRMARILVEVKDPLALKEEGPTVPLLLGAFVEVTLDGHVLPGALEIPESALRHGDRVWIVGADDKLDIVGVTIAWRDRTQLLVDGGLQAGDRVITSHLPAPVPQMRLRVTTSSKAGPS